jgi:SAM-dependent methyltransferase
VRTVGACVSNAHRVRGDLALYDAHRPAPPAQLVAELARRTMKVRPAVLDLACGTGNSTRPWVGRASRLVGVDANEEALRVARRRSPEIDLVAAHADATGLDSASFDCITCVQALHWLEPAPTTREVSRLLRAGGIFAVVHCDMFADRAAAVVEAQRLAAEFVRSRGLASGQRLWSAAEHLPYLRALGTIDEITIHAVDRYDVAARLRTTGDVALALASGATEVEIGLDRLCGMCEGQLAFHAQVIVKP